MSHTSKLEPIWFAPQRRGSGWICFKDSPSAPPAPDYTGAAVATSQGNLEATRAATKANRIDQITPYGSSTYSQKPSGAIDYDAYNKSLADYNASQAAWQASNSAPAPSGDQSTWVQRLRADSQAGQPGQPFQGVAPKPEDFMKNDPDSGWQQTITLSPVGQELLDYQNQSAIGLGQQTGQALGRVDQTLSQPFDQQSVQNTADRAYQNYTSRLDPQWQRNEQMERSRLANQGLAAGGEAYTNAMSDFNNARNDAYTQANTAAISTMPQTYQLAAALRNQPLNELNALRTGSQVTNPQFTTPPQQQTAPGANYMGATQAQGQYDQGIYNAGVGSANSFNSGLASLAGAGLSAYGTYAGLAAMAA